MYADQRVTKLRRVSLREFLGNPELLILNVSAELERVLLFGELLLAVEQRGLEALEALLDAHLLLFDFTGLLRRHPLQVLGLAVELRHLGGEGGGSECDLWNSVTWEGEGGNQCR